MKPQPSRARTVRRLLVAFAITFSGLGVIAGSPADAWCSPNAGGSGLKSYGEESYRGSTCDRDGYYAGRVRDHPVTADGDCAHIRLHNGSGWFTQAYSCSGSWVNYSVSNAPNYTTKVCKGTTSVCSYGDYSGA